MQWINLISCKNDGNNNHTYLSNCIYAFIKIVELFSSKDILTCFGSGVIFMVINLLFAHKLGVLFDKWIADTNVNSESNQCDG